MPSPAELIAESFNEYFASSNVRISPQDVVVGRADAIAEEPSERWPHPSWYVQYRVDADDDGQPCLEFYATSRMTNDRHARIAADGRGEHLEAPLDVYSHDPNAPAEVRATAREEFERRNREITDRLRARGFRP
jgi:hypothetical protein